jgi:hypothetical protein
MNKPKLKSLLRQRIAIQMRDEDEEMYFAIRDEVQAGLTPKDIYRLVLQSSGNWQAATQAKTVAEQLAEVA